MNTCPRPASKCAFFKAVAVHIALFLRVRRGAVALKQATQLDMAIVCVVRVTRAAGAFHMLLFCLTVL